MAGNGWNGRKLQETTGLPAGNGKKCPNCVEMAGNDWNTWKWLKGLEMNLNRINFAKVSQTWLNLAKLG